MRARDGAIAVAITALLMLAWAAADWARLSVLILPDPDDMMRLVQIRDWLGGQGFFDLTQYRLGEGLAMHWSRLPDLVPATLILMLEPLTGRAGAELAMVILWPALLFAAALMLLAGIARRLGGGDAGVIALVLGALAYPMTGLFMPGRIDHHGLQLVLLLIAARAMLAPPGAGAGAVMGIAAAASLAIGLESAPLCALVLGAVAIRWVVEGAGRNAVLLGCGAGLGGGVTLAIAGFAPQLWPVGLCDGFTPPVARLGIVAGGLAPLLGLAGPWLDSAAKRLAALGMAGLAGGVAIALLAPACLSGPYGAVDPLLRALWLDHVAEAQPLLAAPPAVSFGYAGLMLVGLGAALAQVVRGDRDPAMLCWLALQTGAVALTCVQLRLAPFGAALAVPVLAGLVARTRRSGGPLARIGAWAMSAGIVYPLVASALPAGAAAPGIARAPCLTAANLDRIAALGPNVVAVPIDMGAYLLAASRQRTLAAPYHRNSAGNLAHYRLFLSDPRRAAATARAWSVRHIAYCPGWIADLDPAGVARPGSLVALAAMAGYPDWTKPRHVSGALVILDVVP